jgi:hypothetical protein
MVCWFSTIFFLSYYFLEFYEFIFFSFQDAYNSQLKVRYGNNSLTHQDLDPDLWFEAGSSDRLDRNQMYELSNTIAENIWTVCSDYWMLAIDSDHSNSRVCGDIRLISIGSDDPS